MGSCRRGGKEARTRARACATGGNVRPCGWVQQGVAPTWSSRLREEGTEGGSCLDAGRRSSGDRRLRGMGLLAEDSVVLVLWAMGARCLLADRVPVVTFTASFVQPPQSLFLALLLILASCRPVASTRTWTERCAQLRFWQEIWAEQGLASGAGTLETAAPL